MKDSASDMQVKLGLAPQVVATSDTAIVSAIIDRQGYDSLTWVYALGTLSDTNATFAVELSHGDAVDSESAPTSITDGAAVPDEMMVSQTEGTAPETAAAFTFADDSEVRKIGYVGDKRYTMLTITPSGNTGNVPIAILALLGNPAIAPVVQAAS